MPGRCLADRPPGLTARAESSVHASGPGRQASPARPARRARRGRRPGSRRHPAPGERWARNRGGRARKPGEGQAALTRVRRDTENMISGARGRAVAGHLARQQDQSTRPPGCLARRAAAVTHGENVRARHPTRPHPRPGHPTPPAAPRTSARRSTPFERRRSCLAPVISSDGRALHPRRAPQRPAAPHPPRRVRLRHPAARTPARQGPTPPVTQPAPDPSAAGTTSIQHPVHRRSLRAAPFPVPHREVPDNDPCPARPPHLPRLHPGQPRPDGFTESPFPPIGIPTDLPFLYFLPRQIRVLSVPRPCVSSRPGQRAQGAGHSSNGIQGSPSVSHSSVVSPSGAGRSAQACLAPGPLARGCRLIGHLSEGKASAARVRPGHRYHRPNRARAGRQRADQAVPNGSRSDATRHPRLRFTSRQRRRPASPICRTLMVTPGARVT
jgi:hypothetical protein